MTSQQIPTQATARGDAGSAAKIARVRFEHHLQAFGLGVARPRLSWTVETDAEGWQQAGYEIEIYSPAGDFRQSTGPVESSRSVLVDWPFAPLSSREQLNLRLRTWAGNGQGTDWSEFFPVETGLLQAEDWSARFVTPDWDDEP